MQVSQTYDYEKNDHINRANMALICAEYFGIRDVSPSLYQIAAPVSEISQLNKDGKPVSNRKEIEEAIPWNERSMKTFAVVYRYEATASFIGIDGKTYVVPNDIPVLDHLKECGYTIAPYGKNLDGSTSAKDSLIFKERNKNVLSGWDTINKNLPIAIANKIDEMENNRPYYIWGQPYDGVASFGTSFAFHKASDEELQQFSLSERKIINLKTYKRKKEPQNIEDYVQSALQHTYLNEENFKNFLSRKTL